MQNTLVFTVNTLDYIGASAHRARVCRSANRSFLQVSSSDPAGEVFLFFFFFFRVPSLFIATFLQCASHVRAIKGRRRGRGIIVRPKPINRHAATCAINRFDHRLLPEKKREERGGKKRKHRGKIRRGAREGRFAM